ncbi:hypothetical protein Tco_1558663, partial [Tanacetum coccineum]
DKPKASEAPPKAGDTAPKAEVAKMMFEPPVDGYPQMYPPITTYPMVGYGYQQQQQQQGYGGYGMPVPSSSRYAYNNHHGDNGNAAHNDWAVKRVHLDPFSAEIPSRGEAITKSPPNEDVNLFRD